MSQLPHDDWSGCLIAVLMLAVVSLLMSMCGLEGEPEDMDPYHRMEGPPVEVDSIAVPDLARAHRLE